MFTAIQGSQANPRVRADERLLQAGVRLSVSVKLLAVTPVLQTVIVKTNTELSDTFDIYFVVNYAPARG